MRKLLLPGESFISYDRRTRAGADRKTNFLKNYRRNIKKTIYLYSTLKLTTYETDCGEWFHEN